MGTASFLVESFLGGEWSQSAQGALRDPHYKIAMNVCLNMLPTEVGAGSRRSGTQFCGTTRGGATGRLIPFAFKESAPYTMEFTDGHLRFWSGASLAMTNDAQAVVSISSANPAKVKTTTAHGWTSGFALMFNTLGANNPLLQNRTFIGTVTSTTEFTLTDAITGATIDGSTLGTFVSGNVTRVQDIATPYSLLSWGTIRSVQAELTAVLLQPQNKPRVVTATTPSISQFSSFSMATADLLDGPYLDPVPGSIVTPSGQTGIITLTFSFSAYDATVAYSVGDFATSSGIGYQSLTAANLANTPVSSPTNWKVVLGGAAIGPSGFVTTDIGRSLRLFSEPSLWLVGSAYSLNQVVAYNGGYWVATTSISAGVIPGSSTQWAIATNAALWTWGQILSVSATGLINPALAGSANIGSFASNQNAAFDGVTSKVMSSSTSSSFGGSSTGVTFTEFCGKDYSGASAQTIQSVTVTAPSDLGLTYATTPDQNGSLLYLEPNSLVLNLRASQTSPGNTSSAGTLLGTVTISGAPTPGTSYTINSSDQATAWKYVWVEIVVVYINGSGNTISIQVGYAQVQFYAPNVANGSVVSFQIRGPALLYSNAVRIWRIGAYSDTTGWPTCGVYHEGRLWLAGAIPNRIDASVSNQKFNFSPTNAVGTVSDSNAISYIFNSDSVNPIFWLAPDQQGIVCGTQSGEWLVQASVLNSPLTPTNMQVHRVTKIGCANIEPRRAEHTLLFVQKHGRKIMEYFSDVFSGKFSAPNLTEKAKHLTKPGLVEIAYQQELAPLMWVRCADGSLIGCTYKRESLMSSQGPTFAGWHRHTFGGSFTVESICVGPSAGGNLDSLSMVASDPSTSLRHVMLMRDIFEENDAITTAWFLDDAVVPTSYATAFVIGGASGVTFNGLWHLNGKTVTVFAGGLDVGDWAVSNGSVSVPFSPSSLQTNTLFTSAFVSAFSGAMPCVVGLTYTTQGQLVAPDTQPESGARNGPGFGKVKLMPKFAASLVNTQGISFGTDFARLHAAQLTTPGGTRLLAANVLFSGIHKDTIDSDSQNFDSRICWQITRPFPATIAGIGGFLNTIDEP